MKPQTSAVLSYLRKHGSITHMDAERQLGCSRVAARVLELKAAGFKVDSRRISVRCRQGWASVALYSLRAGT